MIGPVSFADDLLRPYAMPSSAPPVGMRRLHEEKDGSFFVAVRFPPQFSRPVTGHYAADEEFLVIEGELLMSKVRYKQGDYVVVPAGCLRTDTRTELGALALARFSGPPRWSEEQSDPASEGSWVHWPNLPQTETPLGLGRRIDINGIEAWMNEKPLHNIPVPDAVAVMSLPDRSLFVLDRGDPLPSLNPPLLVRLRD